MTAPSKPARAPWTRLAWIAVALGLLCLLLYFFWLRPAPDRAADAASGADAATAAGASAGPADAARAPADAATLPDAAGSAAFRATVTALELATAYAVDAAAADREFKGKRLLISGLVAAPDGSAGPSLQLVANDYPPVRVEGLDAAAVAALKGGQQITMLCNGAGASAGTAIVDHCAMQ